MSAKHTPGPWINDGAEVSARVDPANSTTYIAPICIAPICIAPICTIDNDWKPSMRDANAALIAAAPDLMAALRDLVDCVRMPGPAGTTAYLISDERMAAARAAINKATGVQP